MKQSLKNENRKGKIKLFVQSIKINRHKTQDTRHKTQDLEYIRDL